MEEKAESLLKEKVFIKEEEIEKLGKKEQESYPPTLIHYCFARNFRGLKIGGFDKIKSPQLLYSGKFWRE